MKYGFFNDNAKEYVITTPMTPLPWINYLGNDDFIGLVSNTGGGYCFYRDAKLRRITRYRYNNVPADSGGRMYYIKEGGETWSPTFLPSGTPLDSFLCRHGLGYTIFESSKNSLNAELKCFVPVGVNCEINQLKLTNNGQAKKHIEIFSAVEWCFWNAVDDAQNFQRNLNVGEVEIDGSTIYHVTEYRERRNHYAFYSVNRQISGFDTARDSFLQKFGTWANPAAVAEGKSRNSIADGWSPIASHKIEIDLEPGQTDSLIFMLGYAENPADKKWESKGVVNKTPAKDIITRFSKPQEVETAFKSLAEYWDSLLSSFHIESSDEKLDRMVNIWNQYQCMVTFNLSRSASYFESGTGRGIGFRDGCQDLLGFVHMIPDRARGRILDIAAIQFEEGNTYHQYQTLTKQGNADIGSGFNDDPLWLVACTAAYIRETGDVSILSEPVPFNNVSGSEKPLLEHLRRSINYTIKNLGPHGLPLIGRADWNDCLNLNCYSEYPDASFQTCDNIKETVAESVFIAAMFVKYGEEYAELCRLYGSPDEADKVSAEVKKMNKAVLESGWDGEWFLRAYDAKGSKVGSNECAEGKIFIEPQGFCVMAGIGEEEGLAQKALDSVEKRLQSKFGVELLSPCYTEYHLELGEISSYPPGYKENGSIFCHNNPWVCLANTRLGNPEQAFNIYKSITPSYIEDISDIHRSEPYVYCQTIAGREASRFGEAKNSWLTGAAAWSLVAVTQGILGIRPAYNGMVIDPCIPGEIKECKITRQYRGAKYVINVHNTGEKNKMTVNGKPLDGNIVPIEGNNKIYNVEVYI